MKFSKRLTSLILVALFTLSVLVCGGALQQKTKAASKTWRPQSDLSKHVTITLAAVQAQDGYDYTNGDGVAKYYSKKFNYTLKVTALTWSNWNERVRI